MASRTKRGTAMSLLRRIWSFLRDRPVQPEGREQRESKRILVRFAIAFGGAHKKGKGIARDLSLGGCMIETDTPLPVDTLLELKVFVDEHEMPVEVAARSEEHTSEFQSRGHLVCRLLLEKKKKQKQHATR